MASLEEVVKLRFDTQSAKKDLQGVGKEVAKAGTNASTQILGSIGKGVSGLLSAANIGAFAVSALQGAASGAARGIAQTSGLESRRTAGFRADIGAREGFIDSTIGNVPIVGQPLAELIKFEGRKERAVGQNAEQLALQRVQAQAAELAGGGIRVSDEEIRQALRIQRQRAIREVDVIRRVNEQADYAGTIISAQRFSQNVRQ